MSQDQNTVKPLSDLLSQTAVEAIDAWIAKYPKDQKQSAVMAALTIAQDEHGYLSNELMEAIAEYLSMPMVAVFEVATFYSMYQRKPCGKNAISVCTNISCKLNGSDEIVHYLEEKLGIKLGQTTEDKRFTLRGVECLGACVGAPMMQVNKDYHEQLTAEKIDQILGQYL